MLNVCRTNTSPFSISSPQYASLLSLYSALGASWGLAWRAAGQPVPPLNPARHELVTSAQYGPDRVLFLPSYGVTLTNR